MKVYFKVLWGKAAECSMPSLGIALGNVVADFELNFSHYKEATAIAQFSFEATPKRFGVGAVIVNHEPALDCGPV